MGLQEGGSCVLPNATTGEPERLHRQETPV